MFFNPTLWNRLEFNDLPVYIKKDKPVWFVPNSAGDRILRNVMQGDNVSGDLKAKRFLDRLPDSLPYEYPGRSALLTTDQLREIWFHITNRCNLSCRHCLFSASPLEKSEMVGETVLDLATEAADLGCRVFALTGGEPFMHREFNTIIDGLLALDNTHVVVLSNGMTLSRQLQTSRWDWDRFHLQISVDGLGQNHDNLRGNGMFERLSRELKWLQSQGIPFTLSMCVTRQNLADLPGIVDFAADMGTSNIHFMWYFIRGRGNREDFVDPQHIFGVLTEAAGRAEAHNVQIDNIEAMKSQVFAPSGTIHDGTTSAWESAAVGPDGKLYPSAALIGIESLATNIENSLASAWRKSPVLEQMRRTSVRELSNPMKFILGGGDSDHSFIHAGTFMGNDPYIPLYEKTALWLIAGEAMRQDDAGPPRLRLKMGDILESCGAHGSVALVHSNCLLALAQQNSLSVVKEFYSDAAEDTKKDILNPVCYSADLIQHIPEEFRFRGYGCGSPVMDAGIHNGESVVDLGCGRGVECFIAARLTGESGRVVGVDMLDPMLALARQAAEPVSRNLGYRNLELKKGYLEQLPLENNSADAVLSNCVMNLSVHKRLAFGEIFRVLKPSGRLVISDVVCETEPDPAIRNDETLRGECIAGALTQKDLVGILEESGFESIRFIKRFPYRIVHGHPFFSLTFEAHKPVASERVRIMYRGPFSSVVTSEEKLLSIGVPGEVSRREAELMGDQVFILDEQGAVTNMKIESSCACFVAPEKKAFLPSEIKAEHAAPQPLFTRLRSGCMACGARLTYLTDETKLECTYCKKNLPANAVCEKGHFVCDACHSENAQEVIERICLETKETDMIRLLETIRRHPAIPLNGPEHHALVPGIILATYKNLGGAVTAERIKTAIRRGSGIAGGYCGFMGVCGAAVGVGIALSLILDATPMKAAERKIVQTATQAVLKEIGSLNAARCCQRDSWIALKKVAEISKTVLPIPLQAEANLKCRQQTKNSECIGKDCPLLQQKEFKSDVEPITDNQFFKMIKSS
jgi:MoaA/NifB/PqqE/SkfB family radical SAM enzyme/SAM-dependent methyltransferase